MPDYAMMYRLGMTPWERYGQVQRAAFDAAFDRETAERAATGVTGDADRARHAGRPIGRALDLGCGRGRFTPALAARGWDAVGVDLVPAAVAAARRNAPAAATLRYVRGDVTDLPALALGTFDLFVDIGCLQGLAPEQRAAVGRGVTAMANPGATLLLLQFGPNRYRRLIGGVSRAEIAEAFGAWELLLAEPAPTGGLSWPTNRSNPFWYRFRVRD